MKIKLVSESKIYSMCDGPFEEFEDDSVDALKWSDLRNRLHAFLSKFSHEEDAQEADGTPGFLLQDDHDNTKTIGLEFNDPSLLNESIINGISEIAAQAAPEIQMFVTIYVKEEMHYLIWRSGTLFAPKLKSLKALFAD
jgi:hypothetical protein